MYMQVFKIVYCLPFRECDEMEYKEICKQFVDTARQFQPELLQKVKVHLLLHLVDCMLDFGPCSVCNTERYNINVYLFVYDFTPKPYYMSHDLVHLLNLGVNPSTLY